MSTERWQAARALFEEALSRPAGDRPAFVRGRAGEDGELAGEVLSLLAAHEGADGFLERGVLAAGTAPRPTPSRERIGSWRLLGELGRGGMGIVYLAERTSSGFVQRAAIKIVPGAALGPDSGRRFAEERRILAALEHPGIARLIDGGTADDGVAYLAMELVEGRPLTAHAEAAGLDPAGRIALFLEVCDAVAHAHQRLVVHRDLKPGNILVDAAGRPRLLDFGIARILEPAGTEEALAPTVTMGRWLTPAYASPEQILGQPTTTATDVYSLGALLFELLAGEPPFPARGRSASAVERDVLDLAAPRPSEVAARRGAARGLVRALGGDLDTIVRKALAKEPQRRYGSVAELADDLRRHLAGRPVRARPDTARYRAAKFLRRHRVAVVLAAAAVAALAAGLAFAVAGLVRAQRAEAAARAEAATAAEVSQFLVELFRISDPGEARGNEVRARELLDRGAERIADRLSTQPAVRLRLLRVIGRAYGALGLFDAARTAHEQQLAAAVEAGNPEGTAVARALTDLSQTAMRRGQYAACRDLAERAVAALGGTAAADSEALADALGQLGLGRWYLGEIPEARVALERSLAIRERLLGSEHPDLGGILNNVASLRWQEGDAAGARTLYERALALFERQHGAEHPSVASTLNNLALAELQAGNGVRARELHEQALAIRRRLLAPSHPDIGESLNNLGEALRAEGDLAAARARFEEALALREQALGPDHPYTATTLTNLGLTLLAMDEVAAARSVLERAVAALSTSLGPAHFHLAYPLQGLAEIQGREGDLAGAEATYQRALDLVAGPLGADHPDVVEMREARVRLAGRAGGDRPGGG